MKVIALEIDSINFSYLCPYCEKKHFHGSNNELHNRIEYRSSHCISKCGNVEISITNKTKRIFSKFKLKYINNIDGNHKIQKKCTSQTIICS